MFADQLAVAIDGARGLAALHDLSGAIWKGMAAGALGDDDAQRLAEIIHARRMALKAAEKPQDGRSFARLSYPVRKPQRPVRRPEAIARRRRLAASGPLPPQLAARFTLGEQAVLRIVGDEARDKGACSVTLAAIAARAGVCRKLAQNTVRKAKAMGLVTVEERRRPGRTSLPNVVKVVSKEWRAWMMRGPRRSDQVSDGGTGGKKCAPTDTKVRFRAFEPAGPTAHNPKKHRTGQESCGTRSERHHRQRPTPASKPL